MYLSSKINVVTMQSIITIYFLFLTYATSTVSVQRSVGGGTAAMKTAISVDTGVSTRTTFTLVNIWLMVTQKESISK